MVAKKIVIGLFCGVLIVSGTFFIISDKITTDIKNKNSKPTKIVVKQTATQNKIEPKYDLYSNSLYDLPLASIMDISLLPKDVKSYIDSLLEKSQGFYYLKYNKNENKVFIILQNPISEKGTYPRHGLEFVEIYLDNPKSPIYHSPGYEGFEGEVENAVLDDIKKINNWKFDKSVEPYRPVKHTSYNDKGKTQFTEYWNYSEKESQKYFMKDSKGNPVSILKETLDGNTYRKEHLFYNSDGELTLSININFDGANITRFTYYNASTPEESCTIITDYTEGLKSKETIYNSSYQMKNIYTMDYFDGNRKTLNLYDSENSLIKKISS